MLPSKEFVKEMLRNAGFDGRITIEPCTFIHDNTDGNFVAKSNETYFGVLNYHVTQLYLKLEKLSSKMVDYYNGSYPQGLVLFDKYTLGSNSDSSYAVQFIGYKIIHLDYKYDSTTPVFNNSTERSR